jgi:hypothetical protein
MIWKGSATPDRELVHWHVGTGDDLGWILNTPDGDPACFLPLFPGTDLCRWVW